MNNKNFRKKKFNIEYLTIAILFGFIIFIQIYNNKKTKLMNHELKTTINKYSNLSELKKCIDIEENLRGRHLSESITLNKKGDENSLYNILDKGFNQYSLVILTSLESCSTCRDQTLKIWNDIYEKNNNLSIIILVSEDSNQSNFNIRNIKAYMKGMNIKIPYFLNLETILFSELNVSLKDSPFSLIIDSNKQIIYANSSNGLMIERVTGFSKFFKSLNIIGGNK